jgi:hypothetical protein
MSIDEAQGDVRRLYAGGFYGQLVSALVWLSAAAVATWFSTEGAVAVLFIGGVLIFPLTRVVIRLTRRPSSLPAGHPMAALAMQIAFTVPIGLAVVVAMLAGRGELFFPASMVIVGAHYLPFVFLYGMRMFAVLSGILVVLGVALLLWLRLPVALGGWMTGLVLVTFAFLLRAAADSSEEKESTPAE